ncbi:E3 ubiquitin-protein ligase TRIM33-like isoform X2 [Dreissena polymorpha]|uniref:E3 ubiquitin-protein ligase TRIM33-like isoform X2 n=1 Tax=Dreissena polymorpha TaxID=45954 RepID=UPI0022648F92|nr:E3 ubiquitin-protein ligase TRIM33-like isoform X2 [Dreissena polymorpha]
MATGGENIRNEDICSDIVGGCVTLRSCIPCIKDNTSTYATQFCTICSEFLCDDCKRGHSRFKPGKHSFIIAEDVIKVPVVVDMMDIDKCEEHKKKIKFFCKDHSLLCCSTCAFIHRACINVDELAKIAEEKRELLNDLKRDLIQAAGKKSDIIKDCIHMKLSLNEKLSELPKDIETLREQINTLFTKATTYINSQAKDVIDVESKRLSERQTSSVKVLQDINDIIPICSAVVDNGTPQQVFIFARTIERKLNDIKIHDDQLQNSHFTLQLSLTFTEEISTLLKIGSDFVQLKSLRIEKKSDADDKRKPCSHHGDPTRSCRCTAYFYRIRGSAPRKGPRPVSNNTS